MKIAITAQGATLDAAVDPRFGRCGTLLFVETDDLSFEAVGNESAARGGGAGIQTAALVARRGVKAVLTGDCGPNAHETLNAAGIQVYTGCSGTVAAVVARFQAGDLRPAAGPSVASHSGQGRG